MVFSMNDFYPQRSNTVTTTSETIPEAEERDLYKDSTVVNGDGKTELVDKKSIFITVAVVLGILFLLNAMEM